MKTFKRSLLSISLLVLPLVVTACEGDSAPTTETTEPTLNIVETAEDNGSFATLLAALEATGLDETLSGEGPFTVFAPTDDAFAALPEGTLDSLLADPDALSDILLYHVVADELLAADVLASTELTTVQGQTVAISTEGDDAFVNDAQIVITDVEATNGVIHVIDAVLLPE